MSTEKNPQDKSINPQSISKQELVSFLENIISELRTLIMQINNETEINLPNKSTLSNLVEDTNILLDNLTSQITNNNPDSIQTNNQENLTEINNNEWDDLLEETSPLKVENIPQKQTQITSKANSIFREIKSVITRPIIAISLVGVVIAFIFMFNFLGTNSSTQLAENIALESQEILEKQPSITETITEGLETSSLNNPQEEPDKIIVNKSEEKTEIIDIPSEFVESEQANIVEVKSPPAVELTPEQSLIASIQNQVAEITTKYADGLILAIEANFNNSYLTITINDSWYEITESEQNKLTQEILEKVQILDFYKLTLIDSKGNLVARNPVVGKEMIIVRR